MARRQRAPRGSVARLTLRGLYFLGGSLGCGIVAYGTGLTQLVYVLSFLALLPLIALAVVVIRPLRLDVTRTFSPRVVSAGSTSTVLLDVQNASPFGSAPATWADRIPWPPGTAGPGALPPLAPGRVPAGMRPETRDSAPRRSARLSYTLRPQVRGVYAIGPLEVEFTDPFGLAIGHATVGTSQSMYVVPAVLPLGEGGPLFVSGDGNARLIQRLAVGNEDDLMTREYRRGDALRRVHWRASARAGELMVRQEEQRSFPEARILIDTRSDGYVHDWSDLAFENAESAAFEWAIRMVASLGVHLHRSGYLVHVVETATPQIAPLGDVAEGAGQDLEFLLSLAGVRLADPVALGREGTRDSTGIVGPIFAVVSDPSTVTLNWIVAQRRAFEEGVAFIVGSSSMRAWEHLAEAGWTCVPVRPGDDPAVVWASIGRFGSPTASGSRRPGELR
ncbi:DUF58 domain-containing protein [Galbitalea soli]|uniref:DUF58 domain-containing protein n=1 Tax=Galbitalea soli TaxID=1268042 RepID=A0A7C9PNB5_9MICO|nr:DUF58 domain-containing protein [Galbitalea soli]NEM91532.1 DUF58 domain-containing protein [Galbitalea soli]NYJ30226.1 uncharacterized protein (DUF58 family) [Galbitalea soli]